MPRLLHGLFSGAFLLLGPNLLTAQGGSYDENALRIDQHQGTITIVRGVSETVVVRIGAIRGTDVASVVSPSAKAMAEAKKFEHDYRPGTWIASLGIATLGAAIGTSRIADANPAIPTGLTIAGVGLITYGGLRLGNAMRALSRSVWWYNRDLVR